MQQAVEQDLGDDHQDPGVRIDFSIACHQTNIVRGKPPLDDCFPHFVVLLVGQRDQRRGVVGLLAQLQRLEHCSFGDQRFSGTRRGTDENSLLGRKPGE